MGDKIKVVADTNTWYDIGTGEIKPQSLGNVQLFSSYVNLFELSKTPKLLKDWRLVKKAVKALHDHSYRIYEQNPIEFIIKKQFPHFVLKDLSYKEILKGFEVLLSRNEAVDLTTEESENMKRSIEAFMESGKLTVSRLNDALPELRKNIKEGIGKDAHRKILSHPMLFEVVKKFVQQQTNCEVNLDIKTYPWEEIELFIIAWDSFFKELEVHPSQKIHPNDWQDLFAMVYVSPGMKFATKDDRWVSIITSNESIKHYLHRF